MRAPLPCQAEIKEHLEKVYGLSVEKVNTCNYLGRKKHGKAGFYRCEEWVTFELITPGATALGMTLWKVEATQTFAALRKALSGVPAPPTARRPDYKKAFVFLKEGSPKAASQ